MTIKKNRNKSPKSPHTNITKVKNTDGSASKSPTISDN